MDTSGSQYDPTYPPRWIGGPGELQDQGHGVVVLEQGGVNQNPIFRSGSRQVSKSIKEVSLYFLGGDPILYIGLVPIDPRSSLNIILNN